jgi:Lrp/AsnC family leucine-responsive transcriptional regulator
VKFAERVALSLSPCTARVRQLEKACAIRGYVALLDPENIGLALNVFIQVTQLPVGSGYRIARKGDVRRAQGLECYLMTGDADYMLRVVVTAAVTLKNFILKRLSRA